MLGKMYADLAVSTEGDRAFGGERGNKAEEVKNEPALG
jgi:hypothetical protein